MTLRGLKPATRMKVYYLACRTDEVEQVAALQHGIGPYRRDLFAATFDACEIHAFERAKPCLFDGPTDERATGNHAHAHRKLAPLRYAAVLRRLARRDQPGRCDDQRDNSNQRNRQPDRSDLKEPKGLPRRLGEHARHDEVGGCAHRRDHAAEHDRERHRHQVKRRRHTHSIRPTQDLWDQHRDDRRVVEERRCECRRHEQARHRKTPAASIAEQSFGERLDHASRLGRAREHEQRSDRERRRIAKTSKRLLWRDDAREQ